MAADQVFRLKDGFYCMVSGRVFGTWDTKELAEVGLLVEQRRAQRPKTPCVVDLRNQFDKLLEGDE